MCLFVAEVLHVPSHLWLSAINYYQWGSHLWHTALLLHSNDINKLSFGSKPLLIWVFFVILGSLEKVNKWKQNNKLQNEQMNECKLKTEVAVNGIHNLLFFLRVKHFAARKSSFVFSFYKSKLFFSDQLPWTVGKWWHEYWKYGKWNADLELASFLMVETEFKLEIKIHTLSCCMWNPN